MLINQQFFPRAKSIIDTHLVLSLCGEAGNFLALDDRLSGHGVKEISKYGRAVTSDVVLAFDPCGKWAGSGFTYTAVTRPPVCHTFAAIFLSSVACG
jgi:hypothetical protein